MFKDALPQFIDILPLILRELCIIALATVGLYLVFRAILFAYVMLSPASCLGVLQVFPNIILALTSISIVMFMSIQYLRGRDE